MLETGKGTFPAYEKYHVDKRKSIRKIITYLEVIDGDHSLLMLTTITK